MPWISRPSSEAFHLPPPACRASLRSSQGLESVRRRGAGVESSSIGPMSSAYASGGWSGRLATYAKRPPLTENRVTAPVTFGSIMAAPTCVGGVAVEPRLDSLLRERADQRAHRAPADPGATARRGPRSRPASGPCTCRRLRASATTSVLSCGSCSSMPMTAATCLPSGDITALPILPGRSIALTSRRRSRSRPRRPFCACRSRRRRASAPR